MSSARSQEAGHQNDSRNSDCGKAKKAGGIGTHVTAITKRRFLPNLQRVKAILPSGEVRYVRVSASAIKKGLLVKAPKRTWKKDAPKEAAKA